MPRHRGAIARSPQPQPPHPPPPQATPALPRRAYLKRYSTDAQDDAIQDACFAAVDRDLPCVHVRTIAFGRGLQGDARLSDRPDLQEVKELCAARLIDELGVYDVTRMTRSLRYDDRGILAQWLAEANVKILKCRSRGYIDLNTPMGDMEWNMTTRMGGEEKKLLKIRITDGKMAKALTGVYIGGRPYGRRWIYEGLRFELDEVEAATYRRIFTMILAGHSCGHIARTFNAEGIPTPQASHRQKKRKPTPRFKPGWRSSGIAALIRAPSAIGKITSMGIALKDCPAIVDRATWERAKAAIQGNGRAGRKPTTPALVRGIVVCESCGSALWVKATIYAGKRYRYYHCPRSQQTGAEGCKRGHPVADVDQAVWEEFSRWVKEEGPAGSGSTRDLKAARKAVDSRLRELNKGDAAIAEAIHHAGDPTPFVARLARSKVEREELARQLAAIETEAQLPAELKAARARRVELAREVKRATDPDERRALLLSGLRRGDVVIRRDGSIEIRATGPRAR